MGDEASARAAAIRQLSSVEGILNGKSDAYEERMPNRQEIILYRMKLPDHECPYGLLAKRMLEDAGIEFDERLLTSRDEVDAFQSEHDVETTPQVFIDGERIGGSEELAAYLETADS